MPVRFTEPDPRIDAVRGCVALERGPLVYCVESADLPPGIDVEDVMVDPATVPVPAERPDIAPSLIGLTVPATRQAATDGAAPAAPITIGAVPYFAWANREVRGMRVWIPRAGR